MTLYPNGYKKYDKSKLQVLLLLNKFTYFNKDLCCKVPHWKALSSCKYKPREVVEALSESVTMSWKVSIYYIKRGLFDSQMKTTVRLLISFISKIKFVSFLETIKNHANSLKMVEGEFEVNTQYHFYMETQTVLARPSEKGQIDIFVSTQWLENTQRMVAQALGKPENLINVQVRRVGGAYGGKQELLDMSLLQLQWLLQKWIDLLGKAWTTKP